MSLLSGLFKKKAGGSVVGNLLRGVVNTASHGILGNGGGIQTQEQIDGSEMNQYDFFAKYGYNFGQTGKTAPVYVAPVVPLQNSYSNQVEVPANKNLPWLIGGGLALVVLIMGAKKMKLIK